MLSEITKLNKIFKKYLKGKGISDIVLFGSLMKGKNKPKDIDILIIFKERINKKTELEIKRNLNGIYEINSITEKELFGEDFIAKEGLYLEGYSFSKKKYLRDLLGFISIGYLKYSIRNLRGAKRIRFYYALMGRGSSKGFLSEIKADRFSDNVIVCDYSEIEKLKDFFNSWRIEYTIFPSLVPKRLGHILFKSKE